MRSNWGPSRSVRSPTATLELDRKASGFVTNWIPILLIAAAAILLRLYAIDRVPPGLFGDEAVEGLDALDVLAGNLAIWFHAHLGREPLYVYLVALAYRAFGVTPLATRLPAIIAGLLTIPALFFFVREWAAHTLTPERASRLALLTTALLAVSFWHVQMTRNAHRDTLLPLVEAAGYGLLWRALRTHDWKWYSAAGAVLGLSIYIYSPGRFVGVFVAVFFAVESLIARFSRRVSKEMATIALDGRGLLSAALIALAVMLPLGIYFAQNPAQFSRRFASVSIFDYDVPLAAFGSSVTGNLAQFVVPGGGYQSKHYNLPGKPVFDLLIAPWFLAGVLIALARRRQSQYRFLLLWFVVMMTPAFLTADMIPKGVRVLGVVPGVFVFPALAMDWLIERARDTWRAIAPGLIVLSLVGSGAWTAFDYFVAWAKLPELPLAFDADMTEVSDFIQRQPSGQPIYLSTETYRHPTLLLLGEHIPTSKYVERATRLKEFDARAALGIGASDSKPLYIFVRDYAPPEGWLVRLAPQATLVEQGKYFTAYRLGALAPPQQTLDVSFNPLLKLTGSSRYADDPGGVVLFWQVVAVADDRADIQSTLSLVDAQGAVVTQGKRGFAFPPLEWAIGDRIVEWYGLDVPDSAAGLAIHLTRGESHWESPLMHFK